jgi:hypothetical protein
MEEKMPGKIWYGNLNLSLSLSQKHLGQKDLRAKAPKFFADIRICLFVILILTTNPASPSKSISSLNRTWGNEFGHILCRSVSQYNDISSVCKDTCG